MKSVATAWLNRPHRATAAAVVMASLVLTGCKTTQTASTREPSQQLDVPVEHVNYGKPQVLWVGDALPSVVFGRPIVQPAADGQMMRVTQPVSTTSSTPVILEYRVLFVDTTGNAVASADPQWQLLILSGGTPVFLEGRAADSLAHDYVIELKARRTQR